jgi:site-specific DNA recombinase
VWHLLTNVTYIGKLRYKDEIHNGEHEAIIDGDVWQRVQSTLQRNGRTGGAIVRNRFGAILKGLLHCTPCDCTMTPSHSTRNGVKRYRYYVCGAAQRRGWQSCPTKSIPAGEIECFVVEQIKAIGRDPDLVAETVHQARAQSEARLSGLDAEERRLQRQLSVANANNAVTSLQAELQERIQTVECRLNSHRDERARLQHELVTEEDTARALASFDPVWETLSPRERARLLQLLIERVDYDGRDGTISITFYPSGIKALADGAIAGDAA